MTDQEIKEFDIDDTEAQLDRIDEINWRIDDLMDSVYGTDVNDE